MRSFLLLFVGQFVSASAQILPVTVAPTATATRMLKDVPNVVIRYYDVSGNNIKSINRAIETARKDPATGRIQSSATNWNLALSFTKLTTDGQCRITAVDVTFTATADLPHLTTEQKLPQKVQSAWRSYFAKLESDAAAKLWFVQDRVDGVRRTIVNKDCEQGVKAGSTAVEELKKAAEAFIVPDNAMAGTSNLREPPKNLPTPIY